MIVIVGVNARIWSRSSSRRPPMKKRTKLKACCLLGGDVNTGLEEEEEDGGMGRRSSTQQLRAQLDQLHSEAHHTTSKANNARLRLIRLSEAAENLRRQAAISLQNGKENDARELLYQKKKVMEALDKSKARIQLLDHLSFKLNEAISAKETHLIDNVASDKDIVSNDASTTVRIVSPKDEDIHLNMDEIRVLNTMEVAGDQVGKTDEDQPDQCICRSANDFTGDLAGSVQNGYDFSTSFKDISSYEDFILYIDQQLDRIEAELDTVLKVSTLLLGEDEKLKSLRVQQIVDLLEVIRQIRERIARITCAATTESSDKRT